MNHFLSYLLTYVNAIVGFLIIIGCTYIGLSGNSLYFSILSGTFPSPDMVFDNPDWEGGFKGLLWGIFFAVVVCGFVATLIIIKQTLSVMENNSHSDFEQQKQIRLLLESIDKRIKQD